MDISYTLQKKKIILRIIFISLKNEFRFTEYDNIFFVLTLFKNELKSLYAVNYELLNKDISETILIIRQI